MAFGVRVPAEELAGGSFEALWLSERGGVVVELLQQTIGRTLVQRRVQDSGSEGDAH